MNLIKISDGKWRIEVKHRLTSEILTLLIYYDDGEANPHDRFDSDFLIKLQSFQEDAFALKNIYIHHALSWCKDYLKESNNYPEVDALSVKGLNYEKLLNDDYIEMQKWENEFQVTEIAFQKTSSIMHGKDYFSMHAIVKDPSDCLWQVCLGSHSNPKYETDSDGYIEYA
jgi:hypothetical protein